jgi:N-methylhydantoinase A/oxoprolinase/acetone carboxylase beta subunit
MTHELLDRNTLKALMLVRSGMTPHDACAATGADAQHVAGVHDALAGVTDDIIHYLAWLRDDTDALRRQIASLARRCTSMRAE